MKESIAQFYFNHPKLSFIGVVIYILCTWAVTLSLWVYVHEAIAIMFIVGLSIYFKRLTNSLIDEIKRIKREKMRSIGQ